MVLIGEFLIFPNWISLIYLIAATWLVHRQVLREEEYLKGHYARLTSSIAIASEGIFEQVMPAWPAEPVGVAQPTTRLRSDMLGG